jgi:peptidoglycan/xylan/chitin deacetylase (PgdA/CDA1 family)
MYLVKTPKFIPNLFPNFTWKIPTQEKVLYLTFDDGPVPEVTPWVLEQLEEYNAKATFFCVGENVQHHPDIFNRVTAAGHSVGSHTFNHLNGWVTDNVPYFHNVRYGAQIVGTELFRPPYGRIKRKQAQFLQRHYRIVMWDVLSGDFDNDLDANQVAQNVIQNAKPGSIVVFHDSLKAIRNLRKALPQVLKHFSDLGYRFEALNDRENITARKSSNQRELVAG